MKAQAGIMEYVLLTFFILFIIFFLLFFLSWWQFSQFESEKTSMVNSRAFALTRHFLEVPMLTKETSMFDDSKLTSAASTIKCEGLQKIFGSGWFMKIRIFEGDSDIECTWSNYPECNYWEFCIREGNSLNYAVPVNIYRKMSETVLVGNLTLGVYYEG